MTVLYQNMCYNEVRYKKAALYMENILQNVQGAQ